MLSNIFNAVYDFFGNMLGAAFDFFSNLLGFLFQGLIDFLKILFYPILLIAAILMFFIQKVAELGLELITVIIEIALIFVSLIKGIFSTIAGFSYTAATPTNGQWTSIFENVVGGLDYFQFDTISYILMFMIWFSTAFAALKIITSMRGGE